MPCYFHTYSEIFKLNRNIVETVQYFRPSKELAPFAYADMRKPTTWTGAERYTTADNMHMNQMLIIVFPLVAVFANPVLLHYNIDSRHIMPADVDYWSDVDRPLLFRHIFPQSCYTARVRNDLEYICLTGVQSSIIKWEKLELTNTFRKTRPNQADPNVKETELY